MSHRHAYRITVRRDNPRLYKRLQEELHELFLGHVDETQYGFYAEDCPVVGEGFIDNDPGYVMPRDLERILTRPAYDKEWERYVNDKEEWEEFDASSPNQTEPLTTIIESITYEYQNDTRGTDKEEPLSFC